MDQIHKFETDGASCGFCNYQTYDHYIIAETRDEARELFEQYEDEQGARGFCAQCLVEEIIIGNDLRITDIRKTEA